MKKLMIALAVAAVAVASQAATVTWGSGYLKGPTSMTDGTAGGAYLNKYAGDWTVKLMIYDAAVDGSLVASDAVKFTSTSTGFASGSPAYATDRGGKAPTVNGELATSYSMGAGIKVTAAQWDGLALDTTYYYQVIVEGRVGDYTLTKTSALTAFDTTESISTAVSINASNTTAAPGFASAAWTITKGDPIPEPTSGLLLLLGVAGLALKRKQK